MREASGPLPAASSSLGESGLLPCHRRAVLLLRSRLLIEELLLTVESQHPQRDHQRLGVSEAGLQEEDLPGTPVQPYHPRPGVQVQL